MVSTSAAHPKWDYAYAQTSMSNVTSTRKVEVFGAEILVFDKSTGDVLSCDQVNFTQSTLEEANFDFSPGTLCNASCSDFCSFTFQEGDSLVLKAWYVIEDTDICAFFNPQDIAVSTEMYGSETPYPPPNNPEPCSECDPVVFPSTRWTCENYSGSFYMVSPFMIIGNNEVYTVNGCETIRASQDFQWSIGGVFGNIFPNEYRPLAIIETVWYNVPANWIVTGWTLTHLTGAGDGSSQGGNVVRFDNAINVMPDGVDNNPSSGQPGSTEYRFDVKQYFDDGTFNVSDEGSSLSVEAQLIPSCHVEHLSDDHTQHRATFGWLNNQSNCHFDPFFTSKDDLSWVKPQVILQTEQFIDPVECPEVSWPLKVINLSNEGADNIFLYIPDHASFNISALRDSNGVVIPRINDMYRLDDLASREEVEVFLEGTYESCLEDSLDVFMAWQCEGYPDLVSDFTCDMKTLRLHFEPASADLNMSILEPAGPLEIGLCDSVAFEFSFKNIGEAKAFDLGASIYLPLENISIVPNSLQIEFPCGSGYVDWSGTYPSGQNTVLGNLFTFDFSSESASNPGLQALGIALDDGFVYPEISESENCFNLKFEMVPNGECGFQSNGGTIRTIFEGQNPCGVFGLPDGEVSTGLENATTIEILGSDPYDIDLTASMDAEVLACVKDPVIQLSLQLLEDTITGPNDSIMIFLPVGFSHQSNSLNLPAVESVNGNIRTIALPIDPPIDVNQTFDLNISLTTHPDLLLCQSAFISVRSSTAEELPCASNALNEPCFVNSFTDIEDLSVQVNKPDFNIEILNLEAACSPDSLEVHATYAIENLFSNDIAAGQNITIDVYNRDTNCGESSNTYLTSFLVEEGIDAGEQLVLMDSFLLAADACELEFRIADCLCFKHKSDCSTIELLLPEVSDTSLCHNETLLLDFCQNDLFSYQWTALAGADLSWLSDPSVPNPELQIPNLNAAVEQYAFQLEIIQNNACSVFDTLNVTVHSAHEIMQQEEICMGDTVYVSGQAFYETGMHTINEQTQMACDSTITLDLIVHQVYEMHLTESFCGMDSIVIGGSVYTETGVYVDTLQSQEACDSIVHLDLQVYPVFETDSTAIICEGDSVVVGAMVYLASGMYTDTLQSQHMCDSIIHLDLTVLPSYEFFQEEVICAGDSVIIGNDVFDESGIYEVHLLTAANCDSIFHLDLKVNESFDTTLTAAICEGATYEIGVSVYDKSGMYIDTLSTAFGCDSIVNLNLTVHSVYDTLITSEVCEGDSIQIGNSIYSATGVYVDTLSTMHACDSIVRVDLQVHTVFDSSFVKIICEGDSILFGGSYIYESGIFTDSLTAVSGCDSLLHLDLRVLPTYLVELEESICEGQVFQVGTSIYDTSGFYVDSLLAANGCDSIVQLYLIISDVLLTNLDSLICEGESVQVGNSIYDVTGSYVDTLNSASACDSIVHLNLEVGSPFLDTLHVDLCMGDSLFFDSSYLFTAGIYVDSLLTYAACDSILVLDLNILEAPLSSTIYDLCEGDSLLIGGSWYSQDTILLDTLLAANGCDSIHTDTLLFYPSEEEQNVLVELCLGDSISIGGEVYFDEASFTDSLLNENNCDSIIHYSIELVDTKRDSLPSMLCEGDSLWIIDRFYFQDVIINDTLLSSGGCDSIATHILTFNPQHLSMDTIYLCSQDSVFFDEQWINEAGAYVDTLQAYTSCDSIEILQIHILQDYFIQDTLQFCAGDSLNWEGQFINSDTLIIDSLLTTLGCDSLVQTHILFSNSGGIFDQEILACEGDSVVLGTKIFYSDTLFQDTLVSSFGCDSVLNIDIRFSTNILDTLHFTACGGDSILLDGIYYFENSVIQDTIASPNSCDSIIVYELFFIEDVLTEDSLLLNEGDSLLIAGLYIYQDTILVDTALNAQACDSVHMLHVLFLEEFKTFFDFDLCVGEFVDINGERIEADTFWQDTLIAITGADSLLIYDVNFHPHFPTDTICLTFCESDSIMYEQTVYTQDTIWIDSTYSIHNCDSFTRIEIKMLEVYSAIDSLVLCEGTTYPFGNEVISESGLFVDTFQTSSGCDSIVGVQVSFLEAFFQENEQQLCQGDTALFNGLVITQDTVFTDTLLSVNACDSIVSHAYLFLEAFESELSQYAICAGDSLMIDTFAFHESGNYSLQLLAQNNCDSIIHFELMVHDVFLDTNYHEICPGESILVGDQLYDEEGTYVDAFASSENCDSIVVSIITLNDYVNVFESYATCAANGLELDGDLFTESTMYQDTIEVEGDCDSIFHVTITIYEEDFETINHHICEGDLFDFNGRLLDASGLYLDTLLNVFSCDSIVELNLQVIPSSSEEVEASICEGEVYSFFENELSASGSYMETLQDVYGCDSIIHLDLEVISPVETFLEEEICFGEAYTLGSIEYSEAGAYVYESTAVSGCDSLVYLELDVLADLRTVIEPVICEGELFKLGPLRLSQSGTYFDCLLYTSPSPRDATLSRMPSSA